MSQPSVSKYTCLRHGINDLGGKIMLITVTIYKEIDVFLTVHHSIDFSK